MDESILQPLTFTPTDDDGEVGGFSPLLMPDNYKGGGAAQEPPPFSLTAAEIMSNEGQQLFQQNQQLSLFNQEQDLLSQGGGLLNTAAQQQQQSTVPNFRDVWDFDTSAAAVPSASSNINNNVSSSGETAFPSAFAALPTPPADAAVAQQAPSLSSAFAAFAVQRQQQQQQAMVEQQQLNHHPWGRQACSFPANNNAVNNLMYGQQQQQQHQAPPAQQQDVFYNQLQQGQNQLEQQHQLEQQQQHLLLQLQLLNQMQQQLQDQQQQVFPPQLTTSQQQNDHQFYPHNGDLVNNGTFATRNGSNNINSVAACQVQPNYSNNVDHQVQNNIASSTINPTIHLNLQQQHPTTLSIPSDVKFLDPVHTFLRSTCIEIFTSDGTKKNSRGASSRHAGQIGLRCVHCKFQTTKKARQSCSFPSKAANIFESVRNFQRTHLDACTLIPDEIKETHHNLVTHASAKKVYQKYIKVYYAEAARELGMVDTPNGLFFGAPPNTSGTPSEKLRTIMKIAEHSDDYAEIERLDSLIFPDVSARKDDRIEKLKFAHVASPKTRQVIEHCRKTDAHFIHPSDYPTISDFRYVVYHQFYPCRPSTSALSRRKKKPACWDTLSGLCCKYCAQAKPNALIDARHHHQYKGMYFPLDLASLHDSSFSHNLTDHVMSCQRVPQDIRDALQELEMLAAQYGVTTKRGSKKYFMKKLWERMSTYYSSAP